MDAAGQGLWNAMLAALGERFGSKRLGDFCRHVRPLSVDAERVVLAADSNHVKGKLEPLYARALRECARRATNRNTQVEFVVDGSPETDDRGNGDGAFPPSDPCRSLNHFVVGDGNRLAHRAAERFAASGGREFPLLLLTGPTGCGKTHLLAGLRDELRRREPKAEIACFHAREFARQFAAAVRGGLQESFRKRTRSASYFLMDDIHQLATLEGTQREFVQAVNDYADRGGRMAFTAEGELRELRGLSRAVRSRLAGGAEIPIGPPDHGTRLAFLYVYAREQGLSLAPDLLEVAAREVSGDFRDLVACCGELARRGARTRNEAEEVLREYFRRWGHAPALEDVAREAARAFRIEIDDLRSGRRSRVLVRARQAAFHVARSHGLGTLRRIGDFFGCGNHSTVHSALRESNRRKAQDSEFRRLLGRIEDALRVHSPRGGARNTSPELAPVS